jgi:hypothetical protein
MRNIKIMDKVHIYKDVFSLEELDLIFDTIKKSRQDTSHIPTSEPIDSSYYDYHGHPSVDRKDGTIITTWTKWYTFGEKTTFLGGVDIDYENLNDVGKKQLEVSNLIAKKLTDVHNNYFDIYESHPWPEYAGKNFRLINDPDGLYLGRIEILEHKNNLENEFTIGVHTDWHSQRWEWPGPKQILTYTFYLNDNYEGGEIDFFIEDEKKMITYKPKRGDITVFPSGRPYWHAARAAHSGDNKMFIRVFGTKLFIGSKNWLESSARMGVEQWLEIEKEKVIERVNDGVNARQIIFIGENEVNPNNPEEPLFIERSKSIYLDGRVI